MTIQNHVKSFAFGFVAAALTGVGLVADSEATAVGAALAAGGFIVAAGVYSHPLKPASFFAGGLTGLAGTFYLAAPLILYFGSPFLEGY